MSANTNMVPTGFSGVLHGVAKKSNIELYVIQSIKDRREQEGLTQADLAFKLDVSLGFIGQVESSNYPAKYNLNHLNKLAEIFNCSLKGFYQTKCCNYKN